MSEIRFLPNTSKNWPCTNCGGQGNIVEHNDVNPRLKCLKCGFMYDSIDSQMAVENGAIPNAPIVEVPEPRPDPVHDADPRHQRPEPVQSGYRAPVQPKIPKTPSYVFLSKDRTRSEFATKKSVRSVALRWEYEGITYDVYELQSKKVEAKLSIE